MRPFLFFLVFTRWKGKPENQFASARPRPSANHRVARLIPRDRQPQSGRWRAGMHGIIPIKQARGLNLAQLSGIVDQFNHALRTGVTASPEPPYLAAFSSRF